MSTNCAPARSQECREGRLSGSHVSQSGLILLTDERWLPGTRIVMTLQRGGKDRPEEIHRVESEVIRWGVDGVGCAFVESGFVDLNNGVALDDLLVHDERAPEPSLAYLLSRMTHPDFPEPVGVFRAVEKPTFESQIGEQIDTAIQSKGAGQLDDLFRSDDLWTVE